MQFIIILLLGSLLDDVTDNEMHAQSYMSTVHKIGTWSVRSLYAGKVEVVLCEMSKTNVEIVGMSEISWQGIRHFASLDYKIFFSGHAQSRASGVGFACHKGIASAVLGYNSVCGKIISIKI